MKIRNGFVSNSSSSSFILIIKNNKELTKDLLLDVFEVNETSPMYSFVNELSDWIINSLKERDLKEIYNNYCGYDNNTEDEMIEELSDTQEFPEEYFEKIRNKEYRYYEGLASDESGDGLESYLCATGINIDTESIMIKSGGSY